ncbi:Hypothetical_protein [Hexamita inflata]|uniref:Hypothetical_protein n=1 Tax=Hexamita inflata TaxID=28002 RepID=A0AA86VIX0_9EUKA|nr:Hypothetical protein HINF_LOCUS55653 [Hexamita inflata]
MQLYLRWGQCDRDNDFVCLHKQFRMGVEMMQLCTNNTMHGQKKQPTSGFEPEPSTLLVLRSNQLSYAGILIIKCIFVSVNQLMPILQDNSETNELCAIQIHFIFLSHHKQMITKDDFILSNLDIKQFSLSQLLLNNAIKNRVTQSAIKVKNQSTTINQLNIKLQKHTHLRPRVISAKWHKPSYLQQDLTQSLPEFSPQRKLIMSQFLSKSKQQSNKTKSNTNSWNVKFEIIFTKINQELEKLKKNTSMRQYDYLQLLSTISDSEPTPQDCINFLVKQKENNFSQLDSLYDYIIELEQIRINELDSNRIKKINAFRKNLVVFQFENKSNKPVKEFVQDLVNESNAYIEKICSQCQYYMDKKMQKHINLIEFHIQLESNAQEAIQTRETVDEVLIIVENLRIQRKTLEQAIKIKEQ